MTPRNSKIAVIGAGAWGTALAAVLARNGAKVQLFGDNLDDLKLIASQHRNPNFLGDVVLPENITPCFTLQSALEGCQDILLVVPSHVFHAVLTQMKPLLNQPRICIATKGLEPSNQAFLHQVTLDELGPTPLAVLSGPSFALEVAKAQPTAVMFAGNDEIFLNDLSQKLVGHQFYVQMTDDMAGVALGGALKNVIAIACGMADGLGYGANVIAALISLGLADMTALGLSLGAKAKTFTGLSGLGDLVLTCTDNQSRNRRFGIAIGKGLSKDEALHELKQTVEGLQNIEQILALCQKQKIAMPIITQLNKVLAKELLPGKAIENILSGIN